MKQTFVPKEFRADAQVKISTANRIVSKYQAMGLRLTLRQLYYQFVAHHGLPNEEKSYKNLGKLISDARLAGLIDWNAIEDRGRVADEPRDWDSAKDLVDIALKQFRLPRWEGQAYHVELWVEKQALAGVLEPVALRNHITLMVNKGYSSQSAMYESARRIRRGSDGFAKESIVLYLGDHDPSGEDMVRDVHDRLVLFGCRGLEVIKVALTMDQVDEYDPPPNPAKITDSRARAYIEKYGDSSWEVDALDPAVLVKLIQEQIDEHLDRDMMNAIIEKETEQTEKIRTFLDAEFSGEDY